MKYDFTIQSEKQKKLDKYIKNNTKKMNENEYWENRIIALNIEIGEVSNEIRFFKYWSKKPSSSKEIILDELVDCLHFAFSLGNTLKNEEWILLMKDMKRPIKIIYFDISKKILELSYNKNQKLFKSILFTICEISYVMGYTMKDLEKAYDIKNKKNYDRQKTGY
ncbi:MAG: dUTP diphosphatase [Mycoplasmataceae bacterium]|nr:dUTP diphosphatase [Mycoplasmataceae bacterium]